MLTCPCFEIFLMVPLIETFIYYVNQHIITVFIAVVFFIKLDLQAWVIMPS